MVGHGVEGQMARVQGGGRGAGSVFSLATPSGKWGSTADDGRPGTTCPPLICDGYGETRS